MNLSSWLSIVPAILGCLIVAQAGLNRKIASQWGLPAAAFLNSTVLWTAAAILFSLAALRPLWFSSGFQIRASLQTLKYWYFFPGLFGLALILGGPWCIARWGATYTFVLLLSAQLAASLIWDIKIENLPVSSTRVLGIVLAWTGVLLVSWSRK